MTDTRPDKVQIGCWSLILIALIVMFFSGGSRDVEREVRALKDEVRALRESVDRQTAEIEKLRPKPAPPAALVRSEHLDE